VFNCHPVFWLVGQPETTTLSWRKIAIALVDAIFSEQKAQTCESDRLKCRVQSIHRQELAEYIVDPVRNNIGRSASRAIFPADTADRPVECIDVPN
jgi:hypothetical protein